MHASVAPHRQRRDPLPFSAWLVPLGVAVFAAGYWSLQLGQLAAAPIEVADAVRARFGTIAAFSTATRLLAGAAEAGLYCLWWSSWGWRLPFLRAFFWMLAVAALDLLAGNLRLIAVEHGAPVSQWLALLAGPAAARTEIASTHRGLWLAFGACGLLTLARVVATARLQAWLMRVRLLPVLAAVAAFWIATRLVMWWGVDLMSGRSALP